MRTITILAICLTACGCNYAANPGDDAGVDTELETLTPPRGEPSIDAYVAEVAPEVKTEVAPEVPPTDLPNGSACTNASECASGNCSNGFCAHPGMVAFPAAAAPACTVDKTTLAFSCSGTRNIAAFQLDEHEVSQAEYDTCVQAGLCVKPGDSDYIDSYSIVYVPSAYPNYPVTGVNALEAAAYCTWLGKRLPLDIEWESSCSTGTIYPWGSAPAANTRCDLATLNGCIPYGQVPSNFEVSTGTAVRGLRNMVGNVSEWVQTTVAGQVQPLTKSVVRGDSFRGEHGFCYGNVSYESSSLSASAPGYGKFRSVGFRCAAGPAF